MSEKKTKRLHNFLRYEEKYLVLENYFENDITLKDGYLIFSYT